MPPSTAYRELWGDQQVLPVLCSILGVPSCPWGSVSAALRPLGLRPTASFVTWRRGAGLGAGLRVELDQTDFGYGLGELEQLVGTPEDVPAARDTVEGLCRALGAEPERRVPGKLSVFLSRRRPHYFRLLQGVGRLEGVGPELGGAAEIPPLPE